MKYSMETKWKNIFMKYEIKKHECINCVMYYRLCFLTLPHHMYFTGIELSWTISQC